MGYRSRVKACVYGKREQVDLYIIKHKMVHGSNNVFEKFNMAEKTKDRYVEGISFIEREANEWKQTTEDGNEKLTVQKIDYKIVDLYGSDWKWYDDFDDVKAWHKFMEEAEEFGLMYEFVRIGEESDDVEELRSDDNENYLYPVTSIEADY